MITLQSTHTKQQSHISFAKCYNFG